MVLVEACIVFQLWLRPVNWMFCLL